MSGAGWFKFMICVIRGSVTCARRPSSDRLPMLPSRMSPSKWIARAKRREIRGTRPVGTGLGGPSDTAITCDLSGRRTNATLRLFERRELLGKVQFHASSPSARIVNPRVPSDTLSLISRESSRRFSVVGADF